MNLIKIAVMAKRKFSEFYDVKRYRKQASQQLVVKRYALGRRKIMVDEEK